MIIAKGRYLYSLIELASESESSSECFVRQTAVTGGGRIVKSVRGNGKQPNHSRFLLSTVQHISAVIVERHQHYQHDQHYLLQSLEEWRIRRNDTDEDRWSPNKFLMLSSLTLGHTMLSLNLNNSDDNTGWLSVVSVNTPSKPSPPAHLTMVTLSTCFLIPGFFSFLGLLSQSLLLSRNR